MINKKPLKKIYIFKLIIVTLFLGHYLFFKEAGGTIIIKDLKLDLSPAPNRDNSSPIVGEKDLTFIINKDAKNLKIHGKYATKPKTRKYIYNLPVVLGYSKEDRVSDKAIKRSLEVLHLSYTLWCEGRSNGTLGMLYIGSVIMNRVKDYNFPNGLMDVLHQHKQFSCWGSDGGKQITPVSSDYFEFLQALELSTKLIMRTLDVNTNSMHYLKTNYKQEWTESYAIDLVYKDHVFYIEK